jgi:hypothetical protein
VCLLDIPPAGSTAKGGLLKVFLAQFNSKQGIVSGVVFLALVQLKQTNRLHIMHCWRVCSCLQLFILDGAQYDQRFLGESGRAMLAAGGAEADAQLEACTLLHNNKNAPLITSLAGCRADDCGRLLLQTQVGGRGLQEC